jgi:hypothetical protein
MGSMPRLKIKDEIRYRKGSTNEAVNCRYCVNFTNGDSGNPVQFNVKGFCRLIGKRDLVRYRVRGDYTCDRQSRIVLPGG